MHLLEKVNNRQIIYHDVRNDLSEFNTADLKNWMAFVIADDSKHPLLTPFAETSITKSLLYMCAAGKACEDIVELFDYMMVEREINKEHLPTWYFKEDDVLMTTSHKSIEEGFWFAATVAGYGGFPIETVLVANFTNLDYHSTMGGALHKN